MTHRFMSSSMVHPLHTQSLRRLLHATRQVVSLEKLAGTRLPQNPLDELIATTAVVEQSSKRCTATSSGSQDTNDIQSDRRPTEASASLSGGKDFWNLSQEADHLYCLTGSHWYWTKRAKKGIYQHGASSHDSGEGLQSSKGGNPPKTLEIFSSHRTGVEETSVHIMPGSAGDNGQHMAATIRPNRQSLCAITRTQ